MFSSYTIAQAQAEMLKHTASQISSGQITLPDCDDRANADEIVSQPTPCHDSMLNRKSSALK